MCNESSDWLGQGDARQFNFCQTQVQSRSLTKKHQENSVNLTYPEEKITSKSQSCNIPPTWTLLPWNIPKHCKLARDLNGVKGLGCKARDAPTGQICKVAIFLPWLSWLHVKSHLDFWDFVQNITMNGMLRHVDAWSAWALNMPDAPTKTLPSGYNR